MKLHNRIRTLRTVHRLTGREVAEKIGVSHSAYRNYEIGNREPCVDIIIKIAEFYHVTTDYLLGVDDTAPESSSKVIAERYNLSHLEKKILEFFMTLEHRERQQFVTAIRFIEDNEIAIFEKHLADALSLETNCHEKKQL